MVIAQDVTEFLALWPILAIPEFFILLTLSKVFRAGGSSKSKLFLCSLPGILIAFSWYNSVGIFFDPGHLLWTLVIAPTNIFSPFAFLYSIISEFFIQKKHDSAARGKKTETLFMIVLLFLYLYEQLIMILVAGDAAE